MNLAIDYLLIRKNFGSQTLFLIFYSIFRKYFLIFAYEPEQHPNLIQGQK